jgi:hypothetical protein
VALSFLILEAVYFSDIKGSASIFCLRRSKVLFLVFRRLVAIRINDVDMLVRIFEAYWAVSALNVLGRS